VATELSWDDADELGLILAEKFPHQNPLEVRLDDLRRFVTELPVFSDDPNASDETKLEAIQSAWYAEYQDGRK
jgi:FeS assembly protein IscX